MTQRLLAVMVAGLLLIDEAAVADPGRGKDDDYKYAQSGTIEASGGFGIGWTNRLFTFNIAPNIGLFLVHGFQVSVLTNMTYIKPNDQRYSITGTLQGEPSYHLAIDRDQSLFLFAGVGIGVGFTNRLAAFELSPRAGANLLFGRAGVITPAVRLPILFHHNPSTLVGIEGEISIGTYF